VADGRDEAVANADVGVVARIAAAIETADHAALKAIRREYHRLNHALRVAARHA
jgi:hypothetical protein